VQLLAIGLAASLVIGPAPVDSGKAEPPTEVQPEDEPAGEAPLPDVDDPHAEVEPEPEPEPTPEPEPERQPEPPPPKLEQTEATPPPAAPVKRDKLGCGGSKPCRSMTIAGIVVGTLGVAATGTGIGLLVKRDEVIPESPAFVTSTRPAGLVTVTLGAGMTLTAVLMLVAAHRGYKQRGEQARVVPIANGLRF
jgi:hypothetical protein